MYKWIFADNVYGHQEEAALLQGSTYTYKLQTNKGQVISIPAKQINSSMFYYYNEIKF